MTDQFREDHPNGYPAGAQSETHNSAATHKTMRRHDTGNAGWLHGGDPTKRPTYDHNPVWKRANKGNRWDRKL